MNISTNLTRSKINRYGKAIGTLAPDFDLPSHLSGEQVALNQYRGRRVLLVFSSPHCGPCTHLAQQLEKRHRGMSEQPEEKQVTMIAVSDDAEATRAKAEELGLTYTIAIQQQRWQIARLFEGPYATPAAYLIDTDGKILGKGTGEPEILGLLEGEEFLPTRRELLKGAAGMAGLWAFGACLGSAIAQEEFVVEEDGLVVALCGGQRYDLRTQCCVQGFGVLNRFPMDDDCWRPTGCLSSCPNRVQVPGYNCIPNLCGGQGGVPLPDGFGPADFSECCNQHDCCWTQCGDVRSACDFNLGECMRQRCRDTHVGAMAEFLGACIGAVDLTVSLVQSSVGDQFWVAAQREACMCCPSSSLPTEPDPTILQVPDQCSPGSSACRGGSAVCRFALDPRGLCICSRDVHGAARCSGNVACNAAVACSSNAVCESIFGSGWTCIPGGCCGVTPGVCHPPCGIFLGQTGGFEVGTEEWHGGYDEAMDFTEEQQEPQEEPPPSEPAPDWIPEWGDGSGWSYSEEWGTWYYSYGPWTYWDGYGWWA